MFDSLLNFSTTELSLTRIAISSAIAIILGLMISATYLITHRRAHSDNLPVTLLVLPVIISVVIMLIGNNIAGAFSLAGIFSIIKFRSAAGNAKEIMYVLLCVAAGLAIGVGEYSIGFLVSIILCIVMLIAYFLKFGQSGNFDGQLTLLAPENEDLNVFTPVIQKYTKNYKVSRVTTKDLGTLFEIIYKIQLKDSDDTKSLIDELRTINGNLKISYTTEIVDKGEL